MQKFRVITADPPWSFSDKLTMSDVARGALSNYKVMTLKDIKDLPIKDFADPDGSILALWVPSSLLQEGLDTMKAWGFKHKQTYIWVKTKKDPFEKIRKIFLDLWKIQDAFRDQVTPIKFMSNMKKAIKGITGTAQLKDTLAFGMGRLFRQTHEICLIGINNKKIYKHLANKSQRSVSFGENLKHSAKPEHLQDELDIMFPQGNRLELFGRRNKPGWICLGNEICDGEDITVSLAKLV
jgi:N6-adenosine-specific RNA methylase IME4